MDQYVHAFAQYPNADFHYVGHSNGTYLGARALKDYPAFRLRHVLFAGSVVRCDFPWARIIADGRVARFQNLVASADWVVAWFPKSVEWIPAFDLGAGGFDGFRDAGRSGEVRQLRYVKGGHGAGIVEDHWGQIAQFIADGTEMRADPARPDLYADRHDPLIAAVARTRLVLPLLILVLVGLVPLLCLGHGFHAPGLLALVLYLIVLRFFVLRF
jgi:pimeloyl-ACP methyl ester carboxylesterase